MSPKAPRPVWWDRAAAGVIAYGNNQNSLDNLAALRAQASQRLHRPRLVERVHRLGARALFEFVNELDQSHGLGSDLDQRLERYARLDPAVLPALGGDRLPVSPVRIVGGAA